MMRRLRSVLSWLINSALTVKQLEGTSLWRLSGGRCPSDYFEDQREGYVSRVLQWLPLQYLRMSVYVSRAMIQRAYRCRVRSDIMRVVIARGKIVGELVDGSQW
mmetsp:Transcript_53940/g.122788  ORF Transcript_53940/g.122788 Transcript_53940/m.122788 type:complete len:104 (+) Transcript_53940:491-802(+)